MNIQVLAGNAQEDFPCFTMIKVVTWYRVDILLREKSYM